MEVWWFDRVRFEVHGMFFFSLHFGTKHSSICFASVTWNGSEIFLKLANQVEWNEARLRIAVWQITNGDYTSTYEIVVGIHLWLLLMFSRVIHWSRSTNSMTFGIVSIAKDDMSLRMKNSLESLTLHPIQSHTAHMKLMLSICFHTFHAATKNWTVLYALMMRSTKYCTVIENVTWCAMAKRAVMNYKKKENPVNIVYCKRWDNRQPHTRLWIPK